MLKLLSIRASLAISLALLAFTPKTCEKQQNHEPKTIVKVANPGYSFSIEESGLKLDPDNKEQCAHYLHFKANTKTGFKLYAATIGDILNQLLGIPKINIRMDTDSLYGKFFNVFYKGTMSKDRSWVVISTLLDHYGMKVSKETKEIGALQLYVKDSLKLSGFVSDGMEVKGGGSAMKMTRSGKKIAFGNAPLKNITGFLEGYYSKRIFYKGPSTKRYDFDFRLKDDLQKMKGFLEERYGLSLKSAKEAATVYEIREK